MAARSGASKTRWGTTILLMFVSLISYLDRNTLAVLAPAILKDTGLTTEQYGWVISAFSLAYMIGNPVWGYLLDRVGLTGGLAVAVLIWTTASASHALLTGLAGFVAARALLGWAEGATFPAGLRGTAETLPERWRSRGMAIAYSGGSLGAVITPLVVNPLAVHFGWRAAFWFTGLVGLLWLGIWTAYRSRLPNTAPTPMRRIPLPGFLEARFWALVCAYALGAGPLVCGIYLAPLYLVRALHVPQGNLGYLLFIPPLGWELGYFFWAWIDDRFVHGRVRPTGIFAVMTALSLPIGGITLASSLPVVMFLFFFAMFMAAGFVILGLRYGTRVYSKAHTALVAGIGAGSWSALVAVLMPGLGRLFDLEQYAASFLILALLPVAGFAGWYLLSVKQPAATDLHDITR